MYLDNKYTLLYFKIIKNAISRKFKSKTEAKRHLGYIEEHHIIPKSLGGDNSNDNLVYLTAREHFICHRLLIKMTSDDARIKMCMALQAMLISSNKHHRSQKTEFMTSKKFQELREEIANHLSKSRKGIAPACVGWNKGKQMSTISKLKLSNSLTGKASPRKGMSSPSSSGINHHNYDHTTYKFTNDDGITEVCTQHQLRTKYNLKRSGLSMLVSGIKKKYCGWILS
jgi:hypothetical protein